MRPLKRNTKKIDPTSLVLPVGRNGWVAGLKWVPEADAGTKSRFRFIKAYPGTHRVALGKKGKRNIGYGCPGRLYQRRTLYSLAAAFLLHEGDNSYGIYQIDDARWLFLATLKGQPSVMSDVVGTMNDVQSALTRFLSFNDTPAEGWKVAASSETATNWQILTQRLNRQQLRQARLVRLTSPYKFIIAASLLAGAVASGGYWQHQKELATQQAAALAALKAEQVKARQQEQGQRLPHPWAKAWPTSYFLSKCYFTRQPLPVSVTGWILNAGECVSDGMRLRYDARPGSTAADFDRRVREIFGQTASFKFLEGAKSGDVFIPFIIDSDPIPWRDEPVPMARVQLMRFVSHFQRRNIDVPLSEVVPPARAPGDSPDEPVQDWHEYTFTINSRLAPEWLLTDFDETGIRLHSIAFTLSAEGQFDYKIQGHLYAQK
ncbi:type 4b pilus protein PilO2 [Brenneria izbisi]|uniref:Type 4b pilus protein PilO2 n=1 Tax=Brenneria izbisi TaxID=2939450 RepID=A0AA41Y264_9GAMM|nr:type 4b pilus protein PilO2 [Brenneria izbisi]MCV9879284.1 type 4b pilus protein PilO2 [Brenneria izbisi]MCV9883880.1 type 4b pilus protein PilO2 [Brenneria izbisi]